MKKRTNVLVTLGLTAAILLTGCGGGAQSEATAPTKEAAVTEAAAEETAVPEEAEEEAEAAAVEEAPEMVSVRMGEEYTGVVEAGKEGHMYFQKESGGKWGVMDKDGNVILEAEADYIGSFFMEYQGEPCVLLVKKLDDVRYENTLYALHDESPEEIYSEVKNEWWITNMREGVVTMKTTGDTPRVMLLDADNNFELIAGADADFLEAGFSGASDFINGYTVLYTGASVAEGNVLNAIKGDGAIHTFRKNFITRNNPVGDDGWVYGWCTDPETGVANKNWSMYNVNDGRLVEPGYLLNQQMKDRVTGGVFNSINNLMLLKEVDENGQAIEGAGWRIYNLDKEAYEKEEEFQTVDLTHMDTGFICYEDMDGNWGYMDASTFEDMGVVYESATSFSNGHAMIYENGSAYVINEAFEIVSEPIDAMDVGVIYGDNFGIQVSEDYWALLTIEN